MSTRINNSVTLSHENAELAAQLLSDLASSKFQHARRTKNAAVRSHCELVGNKAKSLAELLTKSLWTWKD